MLRLDFERFGTFLFFPLRQNWDQYNLTWPNLKLHHYVILDQSNHAIEILKLILSKISKNVYGKNYMLGNERSRTKFSVQHALLYLRIRIFIYISPISHAISLLHTVSVWVCSRSWGLAGQPNVASSNCCCWPHDPAAGGSAQQSRPIAPKAPDAHSS